MENNKVSTYRCFLMKNPSVEEFIDYKVNCIKYIDSTPTIAVFDSLQDQIKKFILDNYKHEILEWYQTNFEKYIRDDLLFRFNIT